VMLSMFWILEFFLCLFISIRILACQMLPKRKSCWYFNCNHFHSIY
jgi:hypothetical protein